MATAAAGVVAVVAVEIEVEGEEDEARGQVVSRTLKARRLLFDCLHPIPHFKSPFASA